jgi:signal recognition particle receptor subunit beta
VDIPGHPRIRAQFQDHINDAQAVIFVVDASTVARNGAVVAEYESVVKIFRAYAYIY